MSNISSTLPRSALSLYDSLARRVGQPTVSLQDGQLRVVGTKKADDISVIRRGDVIEVRSRGELIGAMPAAQVHSVDVRGGRGNDRITVDVGPRIGVRIDGGRGNDTIRVDHARDAFVRGGRGHDHIIGRHVVGGRFDGGRGNDTIELIDARGAAGHGGRGNDRLRLVGGRDNVLRGGRGDDVFALHGDRGTQLDGGAGFDIVAREARMPWRRAMSQLLLGLQTIWQRIGLAVPRAGG